MKNTALEKNVRLEFYKELHFYMKIIWPVFSTIISVITVLGLVIGYVEGWGALDGVYFAFVTGLTIGYGDLVPKHDISRVLALWIGFNGILMTALFAGVSVRAIEAAVQKTKKNPQIDSPKSALADS
jgi:hypothetical protein